MKSWANILLSIWLIATGLMTLVGLSFTHSGTILSVIAIAAGVFLLVGDSSAKASSRMGSILLAVWLIVGGIMVLFGITFVHSGLILAGLGVVAGILLLLHR